MSLKRIYAIFVRLVFLYRGNPIRFFNAFVWIAFEIMLWGFITRYLDSIGKVTFSFSTLLLGAIILWQLMVRIQQGVMGSFFEDVWSQNFLNFFASPLKISEYIAGLVLASIASSAIAFLFVVSAAGLFFGYDIFQLGLALLPFFLILILSGIVLGILAAAIVLRFGPSAEWLAWPIPFIIQPFVGVFYPISVMPHSLQTIAKFLPLPYVFESMRTIVLTGSFSSDLIGPLLIGFVLSVIYVILAYLVFARVYRHVIKSGLITRFSAETA